MAEKVKYTIVVSELKQVDVNKIREPVFTIDMKDFDLKKFYQFIVENAEFVGIEEDKDS